MIGTERRSDFAEGLLSAIAGSTGGAHADEKSVRDYQNSGPSTQGLSKSAISSGVGASKSWDQRKSSSRVIGGDSRFLR